MGSQKFSVTGMTCAACASHIEKAVKKLPGVEKAEVNLLGNSMTVTYNESEQTTGSIAQAVEKAGYGASPTIKDREGAKKATTTTPSLPLEENPLTAEIHRMKNRLVVSFIFLIPLMYISMGHMVNWPLPSVFLGVENAVSFALTQFLLTLPIVYVNRKFFMGGFRSLANRAPNMDSLVALGATASLAYGIFALYRIGWALGNQSLSVAEHYTHQLYFESAATILTLITLGKTLEAISKGRTGAAISALLDLAPKTALVLRDGAEVEVSIEDVVVGDMLAVKPGSRVPLDGTLLEGMSAVDESAITGESIPVGKEPGDALTGATLNTSGYFTMRVDRVGEDTTLSQIIALVEEAGASKAPIAKLADRVSGVFVPIVMIIALACFIVWMVTGYGIEFALSRAVTVLVISCPCALGLATPVAIMVGTGRGAKHGILYKNAEALEDLSHVDIVVLDKTGTLTEGTPQVTDIIALKGNQKELLFLAAGLEQKSEHPLALAILEEAKRWGIEPAPVYDFKALSGLGVRGRTAQGRCLAGNERLLRERGVNISAAGDSSKTLAEQGKTPLYFAFDGELVGIIAVADLPKPDSASAVAAFTERKIRTIMLTGDNAATARAVCKMVGADEVVAEVLPGDKDEQVRRLMTEGRKVAMVGDGINDAPALARADVGIAIGAGTDVAIESADIVLMKSSLLDAVTATELSRTVLRNIKQNLFWAFIYNVIGIPIAAGVFYPLFGLTLNPMFGAAAMSLSSLFVVTNALRLNLVRLPSLKHPVESASRAAAPPHPEVLTEGEAALLSGPSNASTQETTGSSEPAENKEVQPVEKIIHIEGMTCGHCSARVEKALNELAGVEATVDLEAKIAMLKTDGAIPAETLKETVVAAGYEVTGIE